MSQPSSRETPTTSSPNSGLKPALQAVLGSLDVQLEAELTRYRRQKRGEQFQPSYSPNGYQAPQKTSLDLITLTPNSSKAESEATPTLQSQRVQPLDLDGDNQTQRPKLVELESLSGSNGTKDRSLEPLAIANPPQDNKLASSENATELEADTEGRSLLPAGKQQSPDDYLESSEKLVKSLDEEEADRLAAVRAKRRSRRSQDSWLSPLGIGSMLLFLVACGTLVYAIANPRGGENRRQEAGIEGLLDNSVGTRTNPRATSGNRSGSKPVPVAPDLTAPEFKPLDLERLATAKDAQNRGQSTQPSQPTVSPSPVLPSPSSTAAIPIPAESQASTEDLSNLNTDYLTQSEPPAATIPSQPEPPAATVPSQSAPQAATVPSTSTPESIEIPAAPATPTPVPSTTVLPSPTPTPTVDEESFPDFYYVVMDYANDESLWKAREVVPDAYVREFPIGVKIQVAAFEDAASAKAMVEQMTKEGMSVKVYQP